MPLYHMTLNNPDRFPYKSCAIPTRSPDKTQEHRCVTVCQGRSFVTRPFRGLTPPKASATVSSRGDCAANGFRKALAPSGLSEKGLLAWRCRVEARRSIHHEPRSFCPHIYTLSKYRDQGPNKAFSESCKLRVGYKSVLRTGL